MSAVFQTQNPSCRDFKRGDSLYLHRSKISHKNREHVQHNSIVPTKKKLTPNQLSTGLFAWKVVKHTKSNAIVVAKNNKIVSISGGQTSRVDATTIAFNKTTIPEKCVVASDAFFPFKDSIETMAKFSVSAILQPGGSIRDKEVVEACNKNKIAMAFTGYRVFKH